VEELDVVRRLATATLLHGGVHLPPSTSTTLKGRGGDPRSRPEGEPGSWCTRSPTYRPAAASLAEVEDGELRC
jgi:hypothetical protein